MNIYRMKVLKKKQTKNIKYKKFVAFDIETKGNKNDFVLGCFYCSEFQKTFYSIKEIKDFMNTRIIREYDVFATNLAFDFLGCFMNSSQDWRIIERNGKVYSFKYYQNVNKNKKQVYKNPINFYDTLNIFPASVEKLGEILKIPKMKQPTAFKREPQNREEWNELKDYCMNDARISFEFLNQIVYPKLKKMNIKFKMTIGGIALEDFKQNHLKKPLFQEPEINRIIAFKGYYGGRTETFKRGTFQDVYCFDVNSLYPSVMLKDFPNPNKFKLLPKGSEYIINKYDGVSNIIIEIPSMKYPPLPVKLDGKLIFPTGIIQGYYCHNEIRNALKFGARILDVNETLFYSKSEPLFKDFVEYHYKKRLEYQKENSPLEIMEKLILNNLYGKFGFNYKETSTIIPINQFDYKKHVEKATFLKPLFDGKFISTTSTNIVAPAYSFPIISAYVTAYARIELYKYLSDERLKDKIIACDTDSIFLHNYKGEIQTSDELGAMKLEKGFPVNYSIFVRPKMYLALKPKCKGVKFEKGKEKETFMQILQNEKIRQERFIKYRTAINSKPNHKNGELNVNQIITINKELDLNDTKRLWQDDFNEFEQQTSIAINLNEYLSQKDKKKFENFKYDYYEKLQNNKFDVDTFDAIGNDITKKEFLKNEHQTFD